MVFEFFEENEGVVCLIIMRDDGVVCQAASGINKLQLERLLRGVLKNIEKINNKEIGVGNNKEEIHDSQGGS